MKKLRNKWLMWTSKMLAAIISLLGFLSCGTFHKPQPLMYAVPNPQVDSTENAVDKPERIIVPQQPDPPVVVMYAAPRAEYKQIDSESE